MPLFHKIHFCVFRSDRSSTVPGYTFPYSVEILSRRGFLLTARQVVDFPPAMGGKSADLLFDMRVARVAQASLDHASPSGVWLEVRRVQ